MCAVADKWKSTEEDEEPIDDEEATDEKMVR